MSWRMCAGAIAYPKPWQALVCAFYWFNPLAWLAAARDAARTGSAPAMIWSWLLAKRARPMYAGHLLEIGAAMVTPRRQPPCRWPKRFRLGTPIARFV